MNQDLHKRWLKVTAIVVGSFGPVFFLGAMESTAEPARWSMDLLGWPLDGAQSFDAPTTRFLSALTGGFLLGWGVMIWCLSGAVYDAAPEGVRRAVLAGTAAWFLLDSLGSVLSGNAVNVLFNLLILGVAVGPLLLPRPEARADGAQAAPRLR
ncbi:MAG: hypothetical protein AAGG11_12835 [Pseudomonadota bacterium]